MTATFLAAAGIAVGLVLVWQGLRGHRLADRVAGIGTSRISSLAAGEVRVHGTVEPAEVTLIAPLTSRPCVWYRARIERTADDHDSTVFDEERAIGFVVRDDGGAIRVFPRGAAFDVPDRLDERSDWSGEQPPGVLLRTGSAFGSVELDTPAAREAAVAALLTVRDGRGPYELARFGRPAGAVGLGLGAAGDGRRRYVEARLEVGDEVTVVGSALPFGHLADPGDADGLISIGPAGLLPRPAVDEETIASIAEARAAGILTTPEAAWGNAAIPGFGIGQPTRTPEVDARATAPTLAPAEEAAQLERRFAIGPDQLVIAADGHVPLAIAAGSPGEVQARGQLRFLVGLGGAVLAIVSAVVLAAMVSGTVAL